MIRRLRTSLLAVETRRRLPFRYDPPPFEDLVLIDAREHSEFEHGHINGAHLVPRGILEAAATPAYPKHYPPLSEARGKQVVVYCATGGRSAMAAAVLQMMGYKNVLSLAGGYGRWHEEGMPEIHEAEF